MFAGWTSLSTLVSLLKSGENDSSSKEKEKIVRHPRRATSGIHTWEEIHSEGIQEYTHSYVLPVGTAVIYRTSLSVFRIPAFSHFVSFRSVFRSPTLFEWRMERKKRIMNRN